MNIDAEIAEKLFGWEWLAGEPPSYSKSFTGVKLVLEALRKKGFSTSIDYDTADGKANCLVIVSWFVNDESESAVAEEETLPLALCKAALLALGGKHENPELVK